MRAEPERAQLGDGRGAGRPDGVGHDHDGARLAVDGDRRPTCGRPPRPGRRPRSAAPARSMPARSSSDGRPTITCRPSTTPSAPRPGRATNPVTAAGASTVAASARAIGCSEACSTAAARRTASRSPITSVTVEVPVVTVPVLSSTTVSMRRADSSTSGPRIRMPSCAPRPVPTSSAIGVARPSAHGHAMISTATAFAKATSAAAPAISQPASVRERQPITTGHEHGGDPVGQALRGGLAGLRLLDEPRDARDRGVGADPRRLDHEATAHVQRRAGHGLPGRHLDRQALAGQQRAVDGRESLADDAVGGDQLAGPDDEPVAGAAARTAARGARPPSARTATSRTPPVGEVAQRAPAPALGARLEVPADEDEQRHAGRDLEVEVVGDAGRDQRHDRPAERGGDAERDQRVHGRRRGAAGRATSRGGSASRPRRRPGASAPAPIQSRAVVCRPERHRVGDHGHREHRGDDHAQAEPVVGGGAADVAPADARRSRPPRPRRRDRPARRAPGRSPRPRVRARS